MCKNKIKKKNHIYRMLQILGLPISNTNPPKTHIFDAYFGCYIQKCYSQNHWQYTILQDIWSALD